MNNQIPNVPPPQNEPVRAYEPGGAEVTSLLNRLRAMKAQEIEVPAFIGGDAVRTGRTEALLPPHERHHPLGLVHHAGPEETARAISNALDARHAWARMPWSDRAAIFLKAADLLAGSWRDTLTAATMLGQSKNVFQAEIDAACELIDFLRFNVHFAQRIYEEQPISSPGTWNQTQYRPLEGFVFAVTPFNFTAIQANLPLSAALMGNVVLWKPSTTATYSAYFTYRLLEAAGLPPGVINMLPGDGPPIGDAVFASPHLAGLHFTGSTATFQKMWQTIGQNIANYRSYPRIVGETGGKDFILAHPSADVKAVATAIVRGGFEYQGQKCSAASRVYVPASLWPQIEQELGEQMAQVKMGTVEDPSNFVNAVIDQRSFDKITGYLKRAQEEDGISILHGGTFSNEEGYYIAPTILKVENPQYRTMCEEIFGPVVSLYVYEDARYEEMLQVIDQTSPYALTGAIFATDRRAILHATAALENAAGNFYINDKPTGAVVGQQPFGGARASGTNDKAGSYMNLLRWVSPRSLKETFDPPRHFAYPFLGLDGAEPTPAVAEDA